MIKKNTVFNKHNPKSIENVDIGINRQLLAYGSDLMAVKVWFDEDAIGYEHKHHHTQISYVESGEFEVVINGEMQILGAGDSFFVEPHALHGAVCRKKGVLIDIFSPHREDFIQGEDNENK